MGEIKFYDVDAHKNLTSLEEDTTVVSRVREAILWRAGTYKVKTILPDLEDGLVVITLEEEEIEQTILGVPVDEVIKNAGGVCEECGAPDSRERKQDQHVHHIDGDPKNHVLDNLSLLCRQCHVTTHVEMRGRV